MEATSHKLQVTGCMLYAASYRLQATGFADCRLQVGTKLLVAGYKLQAVGFKVHVAVVQSTDSKLPVLLECFP